MLNVEWNHRVRAAETGLSGVPDLGSHLSSPALTPTAQPPHGPAQSGQSKSQAPPIPQLPAAPTALRAKPKLPHL